MAETNETMMPQPVMDQNDSVQKPVEMPTSNDQMSTSSKAPVFIFFLLAILILAASYYFFIIKRNMQVSRDLMNQKTVVSEVQAIPDLPTLNPSNSTAEIEDDLNKTTVSDSETDFKAVNSNLNAL